MHRIVKRISSVLFATACISITSADAQIRCDGPWQIVSGQRISTPYCGDNYLAQVARQYGMRVSARAVRNSAAVKQDVCRFVGHDNRVRDICTGYRDEPGDRGSRRRR